MMEPTNEGEPSSFHVDDEFVNAYIPSTPTYESPSSNPFVISDENDNSSNTTTSPSTVPSTLVHNYPEHVNAYSPHQSISSPIMKEEETETIMKSDNADIPLRSSHSIDKGQDWLEILVTDPEKVGDGMSSHIGYRINTKTTLPSFKNPEVTVMRRYNDFLWLYDQLHENRGVIIPPLPEKGIISRFSTEFIEYRRKELEKFLNRVARHPRLYLSSSFRVFLEADDDAFALAKTQSKKTGKPETAVEEDNGESVTISPAAEKRKGGGGFSSFFGGFSTSSNKEVDQWFDARKAYLAQLEAQLNNLMKFTVSLIKKRRELAQAQAEFAGAAALVGHTEADTDSASSGVFMRLQQIADTRHDLDDDMAAKEETYFQDALKDYLRMLAAVKEMLADRSQLMQEYLNSTKNLDSKKEKLEKMQKSGKGKTEPVEKEIEEATKRQIELKRQFEEVSSKCREELILFDRLRQWEIRRIVKILVQANLDHQLQTADLYKSFMSQIHSNPEPDSGRVGPQINENIMQGDIDRAGWGGNVSVLQS
eukprot:TRINITY_DN2183_c0_g1_i1.p1 TRINITY_DN2183_c0_g1~~TRINITY_DN2183_c0_g1_i1.p1  ORF type:complete len:536 (+),score=135.56 TRINITY_DN2183_c0_g1_i1:431-2038(+)